MANDMAITVDIKVLISLKFAWTVIKLSMENFTIRLFQLVISLNVIMSGDYYKKYMINKIR